MRNVPIDGHNQGIFSQNWDIIFLIFEKGQGRPPPSSYAPPAIILHYECSK